MAWSWCSSALDWSWCPSWSCCTSASTMRGIKHRGSALSKGKSSNSRFRNWETWVIAHRISDTRSDVNQIMNTNAPNWPFASFQYTSAWRPFLLCPSGLPQMAASDTAFEVGVPSDGRIDISTKIWYIRHVNHRCSFIIVFISDWWPRVECGHGIVRFSTQAGENRHPSGVFDA